MSGSDGVRSGRLFWVRPLEARWSYDGEAVGPNMDGDRPSMDECGTFDSVLRHATSRVQVGIKFHSEAVSHTHQMVKHRGH